MFSNTIADITVTSILDTRRSYNKGGFPIKIRVNWKGKRKYFPTGKVCTEEIWNKLQAAKSKEIVELRVDVQTSFSLILSHVKELYEKETFSFENLGKSLLRMSGETLNSLLEQKIKQLKKNGQIGTKVCYENTLANVTKFGGGKIPIENITVEWLKEFEAFMLPARSVATLGINA